MGGGGEYGYFLGLHHVDTDKMKGSSLVKILSDVNHILEFK